MEKNRCKTHRRPALHAVNCAKTRFLVIARLLMCLAGLAANSPAADNQLPDERAIWVPSEQLQTILSKHSEAVVLSREEYQALLRDAKAKPNQEAESPVSAILKSANYTGKVSGNTMLVHGDFEVAALSDRWSQVPFAYENASLGSIQCDGQTALRTAGAAKGRPAHLLVHGKGVHKLSADFAFPVVHTHGSDSSVGLILPQSMAGLCAITLPGDISVSSSKPFEKKGDSQSTLVTLAASGEDRSISLSWSPSAAAQQGNAVLSAYATLVYEVDVERVHTDIDIRLNATLGVLPRNVQLTLPVGAKVLQMDGADLFKWSADGESALLQFTDGSRCATAVHVVLETPSLGQNRSAPVVLPIPKLEGIARMSGVLGIKGSSEVRIREITADPLMRVAARAMPQSVWQDTNFIASYEFPALPQAPKVLVERVQPKFDADEDTLVRVLRDDIEIERTIMLHLRQSEIFHLNLSVPAKEEILSVTRQDGSEPEWRRDGDTVSIRWTHEASDSAPQQFKMRTRLEPEGWAQLPENGLAVAIEDAHVQGAEKVNGYIAVQADGGLRVETAAASGLEPRDGRITPVHGDFAWFRGNEFKLGLQVTNRKAEVHAITSGYATPLDDVLDIHAQIDFEILYSGIKQVRIKVPKESASQFYFDGPQIAERRLDGDTWTITFQKEIRDKYSLAATAQLPEIKKPGDELHFSAEVPVIAPLDVQRTSGTWAVEANTETEIAFKFTGMNETDSLAAPHLAAYEPKNRIIGAFQYLGERYQLTLAGTKHVPAPSTTCVVDDFDLTSVVSSAGSARHQAMLAVRTAGMQYLEMQLPPGSRLLSLVADDAPVKPVGGEDSRLRVQLPSNVADGSQVRIGVLYETPQQPWRSAGQQSLQAPEIKGGFPVLRSRWRVFVPKGFSYSGLNSNLEPKTEIEQEWLFGPVIAASVDSPDFARNRSAAENGSRARAAFKNTSTGMKHRSTLEERARRNAIQKILDTTFVPRVAFKDTTVRDAISFVQARVPVKIYYFDPFSVHRHHRVPAQIPGMETAPSPSPIPAGSVSPVDARITLSLSNVPVSELLRYIVNLSGLQMKVQADSVQIAPVTVAMQQLITREFPCMPGTFGNGATSEQVKAKLEDCAVTFPPGSSVVYLRQSNKLIVKNTEDNLDLVDTIVSAILGDLPNMAHSTAGLFPMKLDLPLSGKPLVFTGLDAPVRVAFSYQDGSSRVRWHWIWMVIGATAFWLASGQRPWRRMLWGTLVLTFLPFCISASWTYACSGLLTGWLIGFVLLRIAARLRRSGREVSQVEGHYGSTGGVAI